MPPRTIEFQEMNSWKLTDTTAQHSSESFDLALDRNSAQSGLSLSGSVFPTQPPARLFAVHLPHEEDPPTTVETCTPGDGSILHAVFAPTEAFSVETDVAWRLLDTSVGCLIEVLVSVATQQLDAAPQLTITSTIPALEVLAPATATIGSDTKWQALSETPHAARCIIARLPGDQFSYLEMVYPADSEGLELMFDAAGERATFQHTLFADSLEKGVIVRARLRGMLVPRQGDTAAAASCFADLLAAAPPLGH
jgi:hypothetical protein